MYFKLSTFMVSICRYRAYEDLKGRKKEAMEQAKIA
jgi:acyl-CoA-binding protein